MIVGADDELRHRDYRRRCRQPNTGSFGACLFDYPIDKSRDDGPGQSPLRRHQITADVGGDPLGNGSDEQICCGEAICTFHANDAEGTIVPEGDYVAILSSSVESASSRVGATMGPIVTPPGEVIAENTAALFSTRLEVVANTGTGENFAIEMNSLASPINRTETGDLNEFGSSAAWTGSTASGRSYSVFTDDFGSNWTSETNGKFGRGVGLTDRRSVAWLALQELSPNAPDNCSFANLLYCIQK